MNRQEATDIATLIASSWRTGLATDVWEHELEYNYGDSDRARRAIERLRRTSKFAPVIADFHEMYLEMPSSFAHIAPTVCTDCNNDGWTEAPAYDRNGTSYTAAQPCQHCKYGKRAAESTIWRERQNPPPTNQTDTEEPAA